MAIKQQWADIYVGQLSIARRKLGINIAGYVPAGGAMGAVLTKLSPADYDFGWMLPLTYTAGNGLVLAGTTFHFAQAGAYTAGAIPFATGAATMGFDAANLFWDDANKFLGVGVGAAPGSPFDLAHAFADGANHIGLHVVMSNTPVAPLPAGYHLGLSFGFTLAGAQQFTLGTDTIIGLSSTTTPHGPCSARRATTGRGPDPETGVPA
jgi:hypothetical protein